MAVRTHYDVLDVTQNASSATIREAYRRLARECHPDRAAIGSAAVGGRDMPSINEAYRVLNDPGRRAVYDAALRGRPQPAAAQPSDHTMSDTDDFGAPPLYVRSHHAPARVPWRSLLFFGLLAITGIVVLAQFAGPRVEQGPDGILRNGDCVEIIANGDVREVACTDGPDLVVRAFVTCDATCPGLTEARRDRQGMGVACIRLEEG